MPWYLTPAAVDDITDIIEYTSRQWGEFQAIRYHGTMVKWFDRIDQNPVLLGSRPQDLFLPGSRSILAERHVVIYRRLEGITEVLRILHQRMDLSLHHLR